MSDNKIRRQEMSNKTAYFDPRGCDFWEDDKKVRNSDIGNYRIVTCVKAKTGEPLIIEFGGWQMFDHTKSKPVLIRDNVLSINGQYCAFNDHADNEYGVDTGTYGFNFEKRYGINERGYDYTRADVLRFLSNITGENYTFFEMNGEKVNEIIETIYKPVEKAYLEKYQAARAIVLAKKEAKNKAFREEWRKKRDSKYAC